jgi:GntR family transcriptional regulator
MPSVAHARSSGDTRPSDRVRQLVLEMIDDGLAPHDKLPTERELAGAPGAELRGLLYELLATRYGITIDRAETTVRATVMNPEDATHLGIPPYSAAFEVGRTAVDDRGSPVERAVSLYRGDRYAYEFTVEVAKQRTPWVRP